MIKKLFVLSLFTVAPVLFLFILSTDQSTLVLTYLLFLGSIIQLLLLFFVARKQAVYQLLDTRKLDDPGISVVEKNLLALITKTTDRPENEYMSLGFCFALTLVAEGAIISHFSTAIISSRNGFVLDLLIYSFSVFFWFFFIWTADLNRIDVINRVRFRSKKAE